MRECAVLKDTAVCSCLMHILSWELGVGYIEYRAEELNGWTGGPENCVEGHHGTSLDVPYVYWELRDEMDKWDRELC